MDISRLLEVRKNLKHTPPTEAEVRDAEKILEIIRESVNNQVAAERLGLTTDQKNKAQEFNRKVKALKIRCELILSLIDRSSKTDREKPTGLAARIMDRRIRDRKVAEGIPRKN